MAIKYNGTTIAGDPITISNNYQSGTSSSAALSEVAATRMYKELITKSRCKVIIFNEDRTDDLPNKGIIYDTLDVTTAVSDKTLPSENRIYNNTIRIYMLRIVIDRSVWEDDNWVGKKMVELSASISTYSRFDFISRLAPAINTDSSYAYVELTGILYLTYISGSGSPNLTLTKSYYYGNKDSENKYYLYISRFTTTVIDILI